MYAASAHTRSQHLFPHSHGVIAAPPPAPTVTFRSVISVRDVTVALAVLAVLAIFKPVLAKRASGPLAVLAAFPSLAAFHLGPLAHDPSTCANLAYTVRVN